MYYVTTTARRKNAKRHILEKTKDLQTAMEVMNKMGDRYIIEIYTGKWELVKRRF